MTLAPPPTPLGLPALWRGRWRARRQAWQARGVAAWTRLSHSEKRLLALCACVVGAALCWLAVIEPSLARIERSRQALRQLEAGARELDAVLRQAGPPPTARQAAVSAETLGRWLDAAGLAGRYEVSADAAGAWRIRFDHAPAAPLAVWLLAGPAPLPLALTRVELQRQDEAEPAEPGVAPGEGLAGVVLLGPISPNER
ncbi:type II secretion system protein GspM [Achromobacter xylosoxidans]|uniref:type II secretion system protein GspM n=1 Tax=Alcaligenes xylosoxydans xylosoxydans TaxID=85698 RepID=UPI0006C3B4AF|nr:type II secretion system protein GspM [Achromobacter xylosoxidans]CUI61564.1 General secretion pathway%2C M protein [Achromobacter xylosoxidans]